MKTISDQLKDLGLKHGDLCEIEGVEGRCLVFIEYGLSVRAYVRSTDGGIVYCNDTRKVTCGWKAGKANDDYSPDAMAIFYTRVLPKPSPKPLPEAVAEVTKKMGPDGSDLAIALLAEVDKRIEAAKVKTGEG